MKSNYPDIEKLLIEGLIAGNQKSYKVIFNQYYQWLCTYVYKLSNNTAFSEDLVRNAMLRLWEKNHLFRSCHNEFLMHLRKLKKEIDLLDELKWKALFELYTEKEERQQEANWLKLENSIEQLPEKCREVFKLSRLEQKRHKEIAKILGISTKTVEVHITRALRFLKTNISGFFF
ncbi:sigma-70 family RNA polymerase sigma factor [uncultured Aquimarina sp.]|uniref:RNA polymerase sigma factor n=1 Tax=uncultured Aquimarina sp. TaxID=575652 RepID=UPI002620E72A|nr:sigma-70 family RNA polymerase sigma factor [uncultured Aquimarina sp.]